MRGELGGVALDDVVGSAGQTLLVKAVLENAAFALRLHTNVT